MRNKDSRISCIFYLKCHPILRFHMSFRKYCFRLGKRGWRILGSYWNPSNRPRKGICSPFLYKGLLEVLNRFQEDIRYSIFDCINKSPQCRRCKMSLYSRKSRKGIRTLCIFYYQYPRIFREDKLKDICLSQEKNHRNRIGKHPRRHRFYKGGYSFCSFYHHHHPKIHLCSLFHSYLNPSIYWNSNFGKSWQSHSNKRDNFHRIFCIFDRLCLPRSLPDILKSIQSSKETC